MELTGLEPRRSDLARGIVIARASRALEASEQRGLWADLAAAHVTEASDPDEPSVTSAPGEDEDAPPRQWLAGSWMPPVAAELEGQKLALEAAAARYGLEAIYLFKIETAVDGVAYLEEAALAEAPDDDDEGVTGETEAVGVPPGEEAEVIYAAPDAGRVVQGTPPDRDDDDDDDEGDDDDDLGLDDIEEVEMESHWRAGLPPLEQAVPFPLEGYPEVLEEVTGERFGIALKLSGPALPGEESVVNAFFALWLSVFQDERADEFEPFQRADVVHDRRHRSALMWVEGFAVPATSAEQTHFLMWIIARINDVIPIAWARYERVDDAVKARATASSDDDDDEAEPFVLAGNPFADRFRRHGEEGALAWAVGQSAWSKRELAGMIIEVALEHDPDSAQTATIAERLLRRALAFDPVSDATGYLAIVLVRQQRVSEAIALGAGTQEPDVRVLVVGEIAEHAPDSLPDAYALLDVDTLEATDPEEIAELCVSIARHAPNHLNGVLELLPRDTALVPYLYNSSFSVERPQALALLSAVLAMPEPPKGSGEARAALVMAWNNACIHAHALGDYQLAVSLANAGQRFGPENPFIYHSGACAYASVGDIDKALDQVRLAIEYDYEHTEKMETDSDLAILHDDPRFSALFVEWREKRADLN